MATSEIETETWLCEVISDAKKKWEDFSTEEVPPAVSKSCAGNVNVAPFSEATLELVLMLLF